ncbi:PREDICTED: uncharacterized protein LOC104598837 [Nelumbo nucifera]|nr:PREDICTED: uncharacterized protein LOC104598837 [Nelumbo nucifera]
MAKKKTSLGRRAWNLLRLALLWARKGGLLKRGLMMDLRILPNYIKSLRNTAARDSIRYGERELSFDDTPLFHFKTPHRPASRRFHIPCINIPPVDFDFDFRDDYCNDHDKKDGAYNQRGRRSFPGEEEEEERDYDCEGSRDDEQNSELVPCGEEEEGIDLRAEEFIAKFYAQIKLQRQISYLQYDEMLSRGAS